MFVTDYRTKMEEDLRTLRMWQEVDRNGYLASHVGSATNIFGVSTRNQDSMSEAGGASGGDSDGTNGAGVGSSDGVGGSAMNAVENNGEENEEGSE